MVTTSDYIIAIPSYNRVNEIVSKTLTTLQQANIHRNNILIFVANDEQYKLYTNRVPTDLYHKIVIGEKGITNQRNFISHYFEEGTYVISMDDDVEQFDELVDNKLIKKTNLHEFFMYAHHCLKTTKRLFFVSVLTIIFSY